jgi:outer membrane biosynthesis protein TonB
MSDHERGAYTPQPDAPLSFDARASREKRPLPLALIASAAVLLTLLASLFMLFKSGQRGQNEVPRPVGEPIVAIKSAPPQSPDALNATAGPAPVNGQPNFAADPEQPMARPQPGQPAEGLKVQAAPQPAVKIPEPSAQTAQSAPPPQTVAQVPAKPPVSQPVQVARATAPVAKPAPLKPAASSSFTPDTTAVKPAAKSAAVQVAKAAPKKAEANPAPAAKALASGAVVVQIGADGSEELARKSWDKAMGLMGAAGHGKGRRIEPVAVGGTTRYRSQVTGFADKAAAASFCSQMKAKGHDCIIKVAN